MKNVPIIKGYLYLNRSNDIKLDINHSILNRITRIILSTLGYRNYDLSTILSHMQNSNRSETWGYSTDLIKEKLAKKANLSQAEYEAFLLLSQTINRIEKTSFPLLFPDEKQKLEDLIKHSKGNTKLNQSLKKFSQLVNLTDKTQKKALDMLLAFSYKTRAQKLKSFHKVFSKVETINSLILEDDLSRELTKKEKLNHSDLIKIESMAKLHPIFQEFEKMQLFTENQPMQELKNRIAATHALIEKIQSIAGKEAPHAKSGTLILYDIKNFAAQRNFFEKIYDKVVFKTLLRMPFFHASLGYRESTTDIEVDVGKQFRKRKRSLYSRTFPTFSFNIEKIASNELTRSKLEDLYGTNWLETIENNYHELLVIYFKDPIFFQDLKNTTFRKILLGLGFRWTFFTYSLKQRAMFEEESVCSEFVTKSLLQCFIALQDEVDADWKKKYKNDPDKADKGRSPKLAHPVRRRIRLDRVKPHEIVDRLTHTGFAKKDPVPPIIGKTINYYEID